METTWHQKFQWKAENFFDDPKVVELCHAIEANDLNEIDRLVANGANVKAKGKDNMTPLLWAFPDNKIERFKRLVELGADPNVIISSDFNTRNIISAGDSVTHLACKTSLPDYFDAVFNDGGDPNLVNAGPGKVHDTPLFLVIESPAQRKKEKIRLLLKKGANIDYINGAGATPVMDAVTWGGQYDLAVFLLEAGADPKLYRPNANSKLIHEVLAEENRIQNWSQQQRADYRRLVTWLGDHGESVEQAKADRERWKSWSQTTGEYRRKMDAEIADRKAKEAREKSEKESSSDPKSGQKSL